MRLLPAVILLCAYGNRVLGETTEGGRQQECYVCRKDSQQFLEDEESTAQFVGEELPICGREPAARKLCPPEYSKGCYTETKILGNQVLYKKCSGVEVSDCQEANGVKYCYCRGGLCNRDEESGSEAVKSSTTSGPETDDEDLSGEGGSGDGLAPTTVAAPGDKRKGQQQTGAAPLPGAPALEVITAAILAVVLQH